MLLFLNIEPSQYMVLCLFAVQIPNFCEHFAVVRRSSSSIDICQSSAQASSFFDCLQLLIVHLFSQFLNLCIKCVACILCYRTSSRNNYINVLS